LARQRGKLAVGRLVILPKHGVNGFERFGAAGLIDAAGIDPDVAQIVVFSLLATIQKFLIASIFFFFFFFFCVGCLTSMCW